MTPKPGSPLLRRKTMEWLLLVSTLAVLATFVTLVLVREADRIHTTERSRLAVMNQVLADNLEENLAATNRALAGVIRDFLTGPVVASPQDISRRLGVLADTMPGIRSTLVLNAQGKTIAANRPELIGQDFSERDYFQTMRQKADPTKLHLSRPFTSIQNDRVVTVARMVPGPGGAFGGLVLASLDPAYFTGLFRSMVYAPDVWAFVDHGDGIKLMNFPEKPGINDLELNQPESYFSRHLRNAKTNSLMTDQLYAAGEPRLVALHTIQPTDPVMDKTLVIGISRTLTAIDQPLRQQAWTYGLFCAVLALLAGSGLYWSQKRRTQIETLASARKQERRDADARVKAAQRLAHLGTWAWDLPEDRHTWSEEVFHLYGRDPDLPPAVYPQVQQYFTPESWAILSAAVAQAQTQGIPYEVDAEVLRPDGSHRWVAARGDAVRDASGAIVCIQGTVQDITEKKLLDLELAEHRHHLEELVQSRTQDLAAARDVAETANRSKAEFLANMSHEIRSPLNAILGLVYLLEQAPLDHDALDMVRKIRSSGRSLLGIINDILDVSKIEAGHMEIEQAPFRLDDVIDTLADTMGLAAGSKNIELVLGPLPAGLSMVLGDALRLGQVLTNLTSNAIKFTAAGRVVLHCELVSRHDNNIVLRFGIQDTGIGIAPELQQQVFTAFAQADSSTTRRFGGTGLGLTICRQLVELMGGEIGVTSTLGQGSEFWFTLPLQEVANTDFSSPDMVRIHALIADDSDVALTALRAIAEGLGWQVNTVTSGAAALAQVLAHQSAKLPQVVVLDWKMPDMDGLATANAIRKSVARDECPIVIMATAYSVASLASQPGAELVDAILHKPVTSSTLYNSVLEAQQRRTAHADLPRAMLQTPSNGLPGVRVLIVDDSDINREVALRILREQGALVTLANNGQEALDWLLAHPLEVDLVLMDVQMPVMDGIEATRQLRRLPQFNDLPIVALTAGAFKSQQDAAGAAGMTAFISKPFDVPETIAMIARLRRPSSLSDHPAPPVNIGAPEDPPAPARPTDLITPEVAVMDIAQGLQIWKDLPAYRDYLRRFASGFGHAVDTMHVSLAANDLASAAALAHKLCGVAANLALPETHRLAGEAERVLSKGYDATLALTRLRAALEQALAAIAQFAPLPALPAAPAAAPVPTLEPVTDTADTLQGLLLRLLAALDTDNPAPAAPILALLARQVPPQELAEISACLREFDFRGAEAATRTLADAHPISLKE